MGRYIETQQNVSLPDNGVVSGAYTNTDLTVNSQGIITAISNGTPVPTTLNGLTDVTLTGPIVNQFLQFNGSDWINVTLDLADINDITLTAPSISDFLTYNGANWVNTTLAVLTSSDIGISVQAWDAELDSVAALTGTGYIVHTAPGVIVERTFLGSGGITISNGDGVAGNTTVGISISTLPFTAPLDPSADLLMFYNFDIAQNQQISIEDAVLSATPIINAINVGAGADVLRGIFNQVAEFRELSSSGSGIIVTEITNDIQFSLSTNLQNLSGLTPTNDSFIVGNGVSWTVENAATAFISLGLGTMAFEDAADYLLLAGGTMTGAIAMGTNKITGLGDPTIAQDAATKNYVDLNLATAGDGLIKTGNEIDVVNTDGSITVLTNEILVSTTWLDGHTDARYYTQTQLGDTTDTMEGASLIGTETKTGLNNATTVEEALDNINTELPFALVKFRQDISVWNLEITAPSATRAIVNNVEVARFADGEDDAVYKDLLLPLDFDVTKDLKVYLAMAKETTAAGNASIALAWQQQRTPGFTANSVITFSPGLTTVPDASTLVWTIPAGFFLALDVATLRLTRLGTNIGDTYTGAIDLFAAHITQ